MRFRKDFFPLSNMDQIASFYLHPFKSYSANKKGKWLFRSFFSLTALLFPYLCFPSRFLKNEVYELMMCHNTCHVMCHATPHVTSRCML
jgi:hypothetical protein